MRLVIDGRLCEVKIPRRTKREIVSNIFAWGLATFILGVLAWLGVRAI